MKHNKSLLRENVEVIARYSDATKTLTLLTLKVLETGRLITAYLAAMPFGN